MTGFQCQHEIAVKAIGYSMYYNNTRIIDL